MDFTGFKWLSESSVEVEGNEVRIYAPGHTDYFNNPIPENGKLMVPQGNAPFYYKDVTGDFVFKAKVIPEHKTTYDAACLMLIQDQMVWVKAAFEMSDFGTTPVVSVVTNQVSDDANGCNIEGGELWLQLTRKGNNVAVHYSLDGENYYMVRVCALPLNETVMVGLEAQCPMGEGAYRRYQDVSLEMVTVDDLRAGK